jgi:hypothetical protein
MLDLSKATIRLSYFKMAFLLAFVLILCVIVTTIAGLHRRFQFQQQSALSPGSRDSEKKGTGSRHGVEKTEAGIDKSSPGWKPTIEPLPDFDWIATPPTKLRPFKPQYHITMGVSA